MPEYLYYNFFSMKRKKHLNIDTIYSPLQILTLFTFDYGTPDLVGKNKNEYDNYGYCFKNIEISNEIIKQIIINLKELLEITSSLSYYIKNNDYRKYVIWFCNFELKNTNDILNAIQNNIEMNYYYIKNKALIFDNLFSFNDLYFNCLITHRSNPYWNEYKKIYNKIFINYQTLLKENEFVAHLLKQLNITIEKTLLLIHKQPNYGRNGIISIQRSLRKEQIIYIRQLSFLHNYN